jgi:hypothetical protein
MSASEGKVVRMYPFTYKQLYFWWLMIALVIIV